MKELIKIAFGFLKTVVVQGIQDGTFDFIKDRFNEYSELKNKYEELKQQEGDK